MPWESLSKSLNSKPRVLAGPVLRKVAPRSVSVWLAMRVGGDVTLTVLDALNASVASGHRHTVAVGTQLHIVCVTAVPNAGAADLVEGVIYRYKLAFAFDDGQTMDLPTATGTQTLPAPSSPTCRSACRASACRRRRWTTCASCAARAASRTATAGTAFRLATSCSRKPRPTRSRGRTSCCSPATRSTRTMSRPRC